MCCLYEWNLFNLKRVVCSTVLSVHATFDSALFCFYYYLVIQTYALSFKRLKHECVNEIWAVYPWFIRTKHNITEIQFVKKGKVINKIASAKLWLVKQKSRIKTENNSVTDSIIMKTYQNFKSVVLVLFLLIFVVYLSCQYIATCMVITFFHSDVHIIYNMKVWFVNNWHKFLI